MGSGQMNAIYQAQFRQQFLHSRGLKDSQQHTWAFLGDGEMDEVGRARRAAVGCG